MADPIARSPLPVPEPAGILGGWMVSLAEVDARFTLCDSTPLAKILVRSDRRPFDIPYGRAERDGHGTLIVGSAPGEWLLIGPVGEAAAIASRIPNPGFTVAFDITHGRAMMRVTGPEAARMLAKVGDIDLSDHMAPNGAFFRSPIAEVSTEVVRDDLGPIPSYLLLCESSSGEYLFEILLEAGAEFEITITGLVPRP